MEPIDLSQTREELFKSLSIRNEAALIGVDGANSELMPANGRDFKLEELYKVLGCRMIQVINIHPGTSMIVDEEGKLNNKPLNAVATALASGYIMPDDWIVGPAIVCPYQMLE